MTFKKAILFCISLYVTQFAITQDFTAIPLHDLSAFDNPGKSWKIVGNVMSDLEQQGDLETKSGTGVLVNLPGSKHGQDLYTQLKHGDLDLELEFMMAYHSNSGIYLQGIYELQLLDSWGVQYPSYGDCGGVYERWDESQPEGQKGYEGYAPRLNACRAPGLWQKLEISFQAPRFDQYGQKTANARLLKVVLNGCIIHENLELTGPTRGGGDEEVASGPLRIQGDHGSVAFRNIRYRSFNNPPLQLEKMTFEVYETDSYELDDLSAKALKNKGKTEKLTHEVTGETSKFALRFQGELVIAEAGRYDFEMDNYGMGLLLIDGQSAVAEGWRKHQGSAVLAKGRHHFEIRYAKVDSWFPNGLALYVSGPGLRKHPLHVISSEPLGQMPQPILVDYKNEPVLLRSFVDYQDLLLDTTYRITHAISVGFPERMSYHYNLSNGALFEVWRAGFLDATPMWDSRGDGSTRALGSVVKLGDAPAVAILSDPNSQWPEGTFGGAHFRGKGYRLDRDGIPTFNYLLGETLVLDKITPKGKGTHFQRQLSLEGALANGYHRAAKGKLIESIDKLRYRIDGTYYIQLLEKAASKGIIRQSGAFQELLIPFGQGTITYDLIW